MNYEELQLIWDSQKREPVFAINQKTLMKAVGTQANSIQRYISAFEITMIIVAFSMAIILPIDAWKEGNSLHHYLIGLICSALGIHGWLARKKRLALEIEFSNSIADVIKKSLTQIEYYKKHQTLYFFFFHLPLALAAGIGLTIYSSSKTPWIWAALLLVSIVSFWGMRRDIKKNLKPKEENLSALLKKLNEREQMNHHLKA